MRILFASSEALPFSKTGGLGDVASALPRALDAAGHHVTLVLPFHSAHWRGAEPPLTVMGVDVAVGPRKVWGRIREARLPGSDVRVLLVDEPAYFARRDLYTADGRDHPDNAERFVFLSRAVLEVARQFDLQPDVVHANDWQTGLVPALLKIEGRASDAFRHTASVFTIHNLAYQGCFPGRAMDSAGIDWSYFNPREMEFYGQVNLLKTGIVFADAVTTVSPTYAREIRTPEFGCGLEDVLDERGEDLVGILNGVDTDVWNPRTDPLLPRNYDVDDFRDGKAFCKQHLQQSRGLPVRKDVPLFGMISRLVEQKGLDLLRDAAHELLALDVQLCILGSGSPEYEELLRAWARRVPEKVAVTIGYDEPHAHRIEAGCDAFLMPSRFEPCGLNQMYSLLYGTLPVVRRTGGLADTVVDATPAARGAGTATGFTFDAYAPEALVEAVRRAVELYGDRTAWNAVVRTGMRQDFSWDRSAAEYTRLYDRVSNANRPQG